MEPILNILPDEARLLSPDLQKVYLEIFFSVLQRQPEAIAHAVALEYTRKVASETPQQTEAVNTVVMDDNGMPADVESPAEELVDPVGEDAPVTVPVTVTTSQGMTGRVTVTFELVPTQNKVPTNGELVIQAEGDQIMFEGVLVDNQVDKNGKKWTGGTLERFAEYINKNGIFGDISDEEVHKEFNDLVAKYEHLPMPEFVKVARVKRSGIVKAVKAKYDDGKLWIKGYIDKRYKNFTKELSQMKMSLEAWVPKEFQVGNEYTNGHLLGLTLARPEAVINPRSFVTVDPVY